MPNYNEKERENGIPVKSPKSKQPMSAYERRIMTVWVHGFLASKRTRQITQINERKSSFRLSYFHAVYWMPNEVYTWANWRTWKKERGKKSYFLEPRRLNDHDLLCNSMSKGGMQAVIDAWRHWKKTETVGLTSGRVAC